VSNDSLVRGRCVITYSNVVNNRFIIIKQSKTGKKISSMSNEVSICILHALCTHQPRFLNNVFLQCFLSDLDCICLIIIKKIRQILQLIKYK